MAHRSREPQSIVAFCREVELRRLAGEEVHRRREIYKKYPLVPTNDNLDQWRRAVEQEPWFKEVAESPKEVSEAKSTISRIYLYIQVACAMGDNSTIIDRVLRQDLDLSSEDFERFVRDKLVFEREHFVGHMRLVYEYCQTAGLIIEIELDEKGTWMKVIW